MNVERIKEILDDRYDGLVCKIAYGETTFFYNPNGILKNGVYFCTIKEDDGPNDKSSSLYREGVFRVSTGITKEEFLKMFSRVPGRPPKGGVIDVDVDFSECNRILPHPIYGWMSWICINSPSVGMFQKYLTFIDISYAKAVRKFEIRTGNHSV